MRRVLYSLVCLAGLGWIVGVSSSAEQAEAPAGDEQVLKQAGLATDAAGLLQFFRDRTLSDPRRQRVLELIGRLGDESFAAREQASADLRAEGGSAVALLRQAVAAPETDVEIVRRAERVLEGLKPPASPLIAASLRLLAQKKPPATAGVLLAYLPFADDDNIVEETRAALVKVAARDGALDSALLQALTDRLPLRRAAAAEAVVRAGTPQQRLTVRPFLNDPEPTVRLAVALAFVDRKEKEALATLVELLGELPPARAWQAEEVLGRLAGEQAPKVPLGTDAAGRKLCRDAWSAWWTKHAAAVNLAQLDETPPLLGYTLIVQIDANTGVGKVSELGPDKRARWEIAGLHYPVDAHVLRHDRVLIAEYNGQRVAERTFKGEIVWEKRVPSPINAQRLANGTTFIACHNQLLLVDPQGKELFSHDRPGHDIMTAIRLRDGQFFLVTNGGAGIRLDAGGKELKSFPTGYVQQFAGVDVLPSGKVLVPQISNGKVVELDADGKAGWSTAVAQATSAVRLPNGNTLIASFNQQRVLEVNGAGETVWDYRTDGRPWKARRR